MPFIVSKMIQYLYLGDYSENDAVYNKRWCVSIAPGSSSSPTVSGCQKSTPESLAQQFEPNDSSQSLANQASADDLILETNPLTINTRVYLIADQYNIRGLKELAVAKYSVALATHWNSAAFSFTLHLMYEETAESDYDLKYSALTVARDNLEFLYARKDFELVCKQHSEIGWHIMRPQPKPVESIPSCTLCQTQANVVLHRCKGIVFAGKVYVCTACKRVI